MALHALQQKLKVGVYARVSTDDQHTSIENQLDIYTKWINDNKCELYDTYLDEAISGTKGYKRKDWQRMIEDIKEKRFDILLVKSFSRFGRNQRETLDVIAKLKQVGIRFIFLEDGIDSQRDATTVGLFAWLAEQEAQRTSERLKLVWSKYNKDGIVHVCLAPYGYDYNPEIRNFVINYEEAEVVKRIFNMYIQQGFGFTKIANILTEEGIKTKKGGKWANQTISGILRNEFYIGTLVQGQSRTIDVTLNKREEIPKEHWYRHPNHHPAIISEDLFYKVQALIEERSKYAKNFYINKEQEKSIRHSSASLFSNLLKCGECGSTMSVKRKKNVNNYLPFYNCVEYELRGIKASGHKSNFIWEHALVSIIRNQLEEQAQDNFKILREKLKAKKFAAKPKTTEIELKTINAKIEQHLKLSMSLQLNHEKGLIGDMQFKLQNEAIEKNLQILMARKTVLENMPKTEVLLDEEKILVDSINELLSLPSEEWTNSLLKTVIDKITVYMNGVIHTEFKYLNNQDGNKRSGRQR